MKKPDLVKLEEFLSRTPVLLESVEHFPIPFEKESGRRMALLAGAPKNNTEIAHSRLSREFERRLNALSNGIVYIVLDFTRDDVSSLDPLTETVNRRYAEIAGKDNASKLTKRASLELQEGNSMFEACALFLDREDGFYPPCVLVVQKNLTPCIHETLASWFHVPVSRIAEPPPISRAEEDLMTCHHEGTGHGTDPASWRRSSHYSRVNKELRADIAAMAGIIRDTGNKEAAKSCIFVRDLCLLRKASTLSEITKSNLTYAIGEKLCKAFKILQKDRYLRGAKDRELVSTVNSVFSRVAIDPYTFEEYENTIGNAISLVKDARDGCGDTLNRLAREYPTRLADSIKFLERCMEGYNFFIKPDAPAPKAVSSLTLTPKAMS
ncbi:MAG TPA: hypothetical protein DCW68_04355 [Rhodospirillaceae bacterium]|nr:MAG: hypothetical protein A2018_03295 [Alphaproteobacteria bacterium GWF2_58_20]HAU29328.1 hypothetical protein [Rhodospirillaceae bacterium]